MVHNTLSSPYSADAAVMRSDKFGSPSGRWECSRTWITQNTWQTCYGETDDYLYTIGVKEAGVNGKFLNRIGAAV